jgi:hypothetical protein
MGYSQSLGPLVLDPAPAGPPVAPPAEVAEALPEPELCALSRVPLGAVTSLGRNPARGDYFPFRRLG